MNTAFIDRYIITMLKLTNSYVLLIMNNITVI